MTGRRDNILSQKTITAFVFLLLLTTTPSCAYQDDDMRLAEAIYRAEGGKLTKYPYGIKSIPCNGKDECHKICLKSIKNNRVRFANIGGNPKDTKNVILFMSKRYCPVGSDHWADMVTTIYEGLENEQGR